MPRTHAGSMGPRRGRASSVVSDDSVGVEDPSARTNSSTGSRIWSGSTRDEVVGAVELDEPRAGDALGEVPALVDMGVDVVAAVQHERRRLHGAEHVTHVDQRVHLDEGPRRARTGGRAAALSPPPGELLVGVRAHVAHVGLPRPVLLELRRVPCPLLGTEAPRVVRGPEPPRVAGVEDEPVHPLGMAGRVEDRHRSTLGVPEQHGPLGPGGVHDRHHVAHAGLEIGECAGAVRHAGPSLVEPDQAGEGAEAVQEVGVPSFGPVEHEVRDEPGDQHQVDVARAGDLVGDVEVVALGVADRRRGVGGDASPPRRTRRSSLVERAARSASSRRSVRSSLRSSDETWLSTVRTEMNSRRAIWALLRWSPTSASTSASRSETPASVSARTRPWHRSSVVADPWSIRGRIRGRPRMWRKRRGSPTVEASSAPPLHEGDPHHDHHRNPDAQRRRHRHGCSPPSTR